MIRLQHLRPDGEIDTYHLKAGRRYHIGRGSNCEVRILDLKLSRKHCVVYRENGSWRVEDLSSTNGCRLGDKAVVGSTPLHAGQTLVLGQTSLQIASIEGESTVEGNGSSDSIQLNIDEPASADLQIDLHEPAPKSATKAASKPAPMPTPMPMPMPTPRPAAAPPKPAAPAKQKAVDSLFGDIHLEDLRIEVDAPTESATPVLQEEMIESPTAVRSDAELNSNNWLPEPAEDLHTKTDVLSPIKKPVPKQQPISPSLMKTPLPVQPLVKPTSLPPLHKSASSSQLPVARPQNLASSEKPALEPREPVKPLVQARPSQATIPTPIMVPAPPPTPSDHPAAAPKPGPAPAIAAQIAAYPTTPTPLPKPGPIRPITIRVGNSETEPAAVEPPSTRFNRPPTPPVSAPILTEPPTSSRQRPAPAPIPEPAPIAKAPAKRIETEQLLKSDPHTDTVDKTFFINVLGRRIGPLTRTEARELKAKEISGSLTEQDLEKYPKA
jgi:hypothetical protein